MSGQYIPNIQIPQAQPIDVMGAMQRGQQFRGNQLAILARQRELDQQQATQNALRQFAPALAGSDPAARQNALAGLLQASPGQFGTIYPLIQNERDRAEVGAIFGQGGAAGIAPASSAAPAAGVSGGGAGSVALPSAYQPPQGVDRNVDLMARTILGEAANQGMTGMAAVGHVIQNRARAAGMSPEQVVLAQGQFEPWGNPATRARLLSIDPNSPQYRQARLIAEQVLAGQMEDPTRGATHFFAPGLQARLGRPVPQWAQGQEAQVIGDHNFYRLGYSAPGGATGTGGSGGSGGAGAAGLAGGGGTIAGRTPAQIQAMVNAAMAGNRRAAQQLQILQPFLNRDIRTERIRLPDGSEVLVPAAQAAGMVSAPPPRDDQFVDLGDDGPQGPGRYRVLPNRQLERVSAIPQPASAGQPPEGFQWNSDRTALVPIPGGPQAPERQTFARATELRQELNRLPAAVEYASVSPRIEAIRQAVPVGTRAADIDLVFAFANLLDPGSVVREGEALTLQRTGSLPDQLLGSINRLAGGAALSPETRANLLAQAESRFATIEAPYRAAVERQRDLAARQGIDPDLVAPSLGPVRNRYAAPGAPPAASGGRPQGGNSRLPRVSTDAEAERLAPGTRFIGPDGREYVR